MFESPYIKINEYGIDLIKNYQVAQHIDYSEIKTIHFRKGHLINNWILSLILSLSLAIYSLTWEIKSIMTFDTHSLPSSSIRAYIAFHLICPMLLFVGSLIWTYLAMKPSPIFLINVGEKKYKVALMEFKKNGTLNDLVMFLEKRTELIRQH